MAVSIQKINFFQGSKRQHFIIVETTFSINFLLSCMATYNRANFVVINVLQGALSYKIKCHLLFLYLTFFTQQHFYKIKTGTRSPYFILLLSRECLPLSQQRVHPLVHNIDGLLTPSYSRTCGMCSQSA